MLEHACVERGESCHSMELAAGLVAIEVPVECQISETRMKLEKAPTKPTKEARKAHRTQRV